MNTASASARAHVSLPDGPRLAEALLCLERDGYVILPQALDCETIVRVRTALERARAQGWEGGLNDVGNMWFDTLLEKDAETFAPLVAHPSVRPYLETLFGDQCQLRSLRAHINPGPYRQEWHQDFYGYWHERRRIQGHPLAVPAIGVNTTFYLQDNLPGLGRLTVIRGSHRNEPPCRHPEDGDAFQSWAESQPQVDLHPMAGDCLLFYSHLVHRGAKDDDTMDRSNVVCHYQACAMHEGIGHVAPALRPFAGSCPLVRWG